MLGKRLTQKSRVDVLCSVPVELSLISSNVISVIKVR